MLEICELTARFIEGKAPYQPGYYADDVAEETNLIREPLARINRCGVLTNFSQPGVADDEHRQRAAFHGLTTKENALKLVARNGYKGLFVQIFAPGSEGGVRACVTEYPLGQECTWSGDASFEYLFRVFSRRVNSTAMSQLRSLWFVAVTDPVWARNDVLWDACLSALQGERSEQTRLFLSRLFVCDSYYKK